MCWEVFETSFFLFFSHFPIKKVRIAILIPSIRIKKRRIPVFFSSFPHPEIFISLP